MRNGLFPLLCAVCLGLLFCPTPCRADGAPFNLESTIRFALKHNPSLRISQKDVATESAAAIAAENAEQQKSSRRVEHTDVVVGTGATAQKGSTR